MSMLFVQTHVNHSVFVYRGLDIRLFREGRMKGQAFVRLPTVELATEAVRKLHGVALEGRPLVVVSWECFHCVRLIGNRCLKEIVK